MSTLIPSIVLLATAFSPNITYQVVTDEFYQHNTYAYHGTILTDAHDHAVYALDIEACETKERLVFHNIVDETVFFNNRSPRKKFFNLQKDYDRCLLFIRKNISRNNMYYNRDYDYWYPNYNYIQIAPKRKIRMMRTPRRSRNIHRRNIIVNHTPKPKVIIKKPSPHLQKSKTAVIKTKHHKKRIKTKNRIIRHGNK